MNRSVGSIAVWSLCWGTMLSAGGCSWFGGGAKPLPLDVAFDRGPAADARRGSLSDRPGPLMYDNARVDLLNSTPSDAAGHAPPAPVTETVNETVISPTAAATRRAQAAPATNTASANGANGAIGNGATGDGRAIAPAPLPPASSPAAAGGATSATYIQLGYVVVEVNGVPIFANKVIDTITPVLAARAKEIDETRFKGLAGDEIRRQVQALIYDELEFATAQRNLDKADQNLAWMLTMNWQKDQVRKAGGSLQVARQNASSQGLDFDEMLQDRYRLEMRRVYFQKKEYPKIQVTADDMRRYYQKHLNDLFTDHDQAQFRVIKIGFRQTGGRDKAMDKIKDLHDRAARGEDFATLAGGTNDDPFLLRSKGDVSGSGGWTDRGAYAVAQVEEAVWKTPPGEITGIIETRDAFYLAKLEQRKSGRVKSFSEEDVQAQVRKALEAEQFNALRDRARQRLIKEAIIYPDPPLYAPALEMAMQKYPAWAKK